MTVNMSTRTSLGHRVCLSKSHADKIDSSRLSQQLNMI